MNSHDLDVFVVDDDPGVCKAIGELLLSGGYAVRTFASGEDFLRSSRLDQGGCVLPANTICTGTIFPGAIMWLQCGALPAAAPCTWPSRSARSAATRW